MLEMEDTREDESYIYLYQTGVYKYASRWTPPSIPIRLREEFWNSDNYDQTKGGEDGLLRLGRETNYKSGKWIIYLYDPDKHIEWIDKIRRLQLEEKLWTVKYKPICNGKWPFIFYVVDFDNMEEVVTLAATLIDAFKPNQMYFKPDIFTYVNIYSGNTLDLKPWIYKYSEETNSIYDSKGNKILDMNNDKFSPQ